MSYFCPVCGFDGLYEPAYSRCGAGSYEICPSCDFEFGVTDDNEGIAFHEWREAWIDRGMPWSSKGRPAPKGWDPKVQLNNLTGRVFNTANDKLVNFE